MSRRHVAVIGAGWAGCAAAVELARTGCQVTLLEAARSLGGRARRVEIDGRQLDNGQHIMLGAYAESLRLMKLAGVNLDQALLSLPLQMRYPAGSGGMDFVAARLPAPLHLLGALLRSTGLARDDKLSLARFSTTARWMGWRLHTDCSVSELLERFDQTPRLIQLMWRPLCLAALNTPPERASAQVFLNVLRDSLGARRKASDMLIPRADLSALFPDAAAHYVKQRGGAVHMGAKANTLSPLPGRRWRLAASGNSLGAGWSGEFDGIILAPGAPAAATLLQDLATRVAAPGVQAALAGLAELAELEKLGGLAAQLSAFAPEAITTCYVQYAPGVRLDIPFYALLDAPAAQHWGQFVFDRGQLDPSQAGLLAVVISASGDAAALSQPALTAAIARQLSQVFGRPELAQPSWARVITEKRATYACTPGMARPDNATALPGLWLAGDYTAGDYPATLEGAARSGTAAAKGFLQAAND